MDLVLFECISRGVKLVLCLTFSENMILVMGQMFVGVFFSASARKMALHGGLIARWTIVDHAWCWPRSNFWWKMCFWWKSSIYVSRFRAHVQMIHQRHLKFVRIARFSLFLGHASFAWTALISLSWLFQVTAGKSVEEIIEEGLKELATNPSAYKIAEKQPPSTPENISGSPIASLASIPISGPPMWVFSPYSCSSTTCGSLDFFRDFRDLGFFMALNALAFWISS